ncbi:putative Tigger transposable element-derived protein 1-like 266 [Homarus americanus]|uniref:Putative Tigger transposable element-derived protein 1-like 266 n=1 Tax=Homarus americanus TaxID=6706 RepID=A0A8J5MSG5_HOMAM|nr:putative Tigger transposable element-derived protein 1-like 266 [Homarus americanus]
MALKRPHPPSSCCGKVPKQAKREKKVMTPVKKLQLLDKLKGVQSFAACGQDYGINGICLLHQEEKDIHNAVALNDPSSAKVAANVRDTAMVKMEKALNIWIEDFNCHHTPLSQKFICESQGPV